MTEPEQTWTAPDGTPLGWQRWTPSIPPRARLVALHGLGCRAADFAPLGEALSTQGVAVAAWNLRGQGLDPAAARRGAWLDMEGHLGDLLAFEKGFDPAEVPLFLCGESMGALLALQAAVRDPWAARLAGLMLFSPVVALAQKNPPWMQALLRGLARMFPRLRLRPGWFVHGSRAMPVLTRIEERQRYLASAPHRLGPLSLPFLVSMGSLIEAAPAAAARLDVPTAVFSAGRDVFTTPGQTREFFSNIRAADKTQFAYAESYHQLFFDLDEARVTADAVRWLLSRTTTR